MTAASDRAIVHEHAICEGDVGARTRVWPFAHVMSGAAVGSDCNICGGAFIEDGVSVGNRVTVKNHVLLFRGAIIEDDVFLGPGCVFTNDARPRADNKKPPAELTSTIVRAGATLGANATVVPGVVIGASAFVAAGSVITRDVPAHALVRGNPARQAGWVCRCGSDLDGALHCSECGRSFELDGEAEGLREIRGDQ